MSEETTNQQEWEKEENWSDPTFGVYFSKADSRVWVPKKIGVGWTLNMGHPHAAWWLIGLFIGVGLLGSRWRNQK